MKKIITSIITVGLFLLAPLFINNAIADLPPGPGGGPTGVPVGGGSPIGGGLIIMLTLGVSYGAKKVLDVRKKIME